MHKLNNKLLNYIRLTSSEDVRSLCNEKLQSLGLTYFLYVIDYKDGRRFWLTNNGEWSEYYFLNEYYKISHFESTNKHYITGHYLWSTLSGQEVYQNARNYFNIDHGVTLVNKLKDAYEFAHFGTTKNNSNILHLYLNHIDLLNQFILWFRDKGAALIQMAKDNMITLPTVETKQTKDDILNSSKDINIKMLMSELTPNKHCLSSAYNNAIITNREADCIKWLKQGKTANEIGELLNISKRTVDTHLENIKRKLDCKNLFQLGYIISQIGTNKI